MANISSRRSYSLSILGTVGVAFWCVAHFLIPAEGRCGPAVAPSNGTKDAARGKDAVRGDDEVAMASSKSARVHIFTDKSIGPHGLTIAYLINVGDKPIRAFIPALRGPVIDMSSHDQREGIPYSVGRNPKLGAGDFVVLEP